MSEARYYAKEGENIRCELCPHRCLILPGKVGVCRVRGNSAGHITLPYYGIISSMAVDPIEKKPLYHFHPGKSILSIGFYGCNLRCPFCQNYEISQRTEENGSYLSPERIVEEAVRCHSFGIAYTYSEPIVHIEYVLETAQRARRAGLANVLVSNGCIEKEPAIDLIAAMDAANIDLKSFDEGFYKHELKGDRNAVMDFIRLAYGKIALEVTTLVIPGKTDSKTEIEGIAQFLAGIGRDIPLHLSCYYPTYTYTIPPTPPKAVFSLAEVAKRYLDYVYPGNVGLAETNTFCPACGQILIERRGYQVAVQGLKDGRCTACGKAIPVIG